MNRVVAYLKSWCRYPGHAGLGEAAKLLLSILAVNSGFTPSQRQQASLERWVLFQTLLRDKRILSLAGQRNECQLSYGRHAGDIHTINIVLRIPCSESSDSLVFEQIFLRDEYQHVLDWFADKSGAFSLTKILDIGANIGCAALFFYTRFPEAEIVCLEPDAGNYSRLTLNVGLNSATKIKCHRAAIWTAPARLQCVHDFRAGQEWASRFVVQDAASTSEAGSVPAIDIWQLASLAGFHHVDLLKMDVEGAEAALLHDPGFKRFLKERTSKIAMEIHEEFITIKEAIDILKPLGFETGVVGEYVCGYSRIAGAE